MVKNQQTWSHWSLTLNEEERKLKAEVERLAKKDPSIDKEKLKFKGKVLGHITKKLWRWYVKQRGGSYESDSD